MMGMEAERGKKMKKNDGVGGVPSVIFSSLPEGCISSIIALTSPKDASRAATLSWGFKSASESDTVWEAFLPADYKEIISQSVNPPPVNYATKKELFFHLCHSPILLNDGKLSFWLSKSSGKICYMLCARELSIAPQDDPADWDWKPVPESRFSEVAELGGLSSGLDIESKMPTQMLSLKTTYDAYLVYKNVENSFGLGRVAEAFVGFSGTDMSSRSNFLDLESNSTCLNPSPRPLRCGTPWVRSRRYPCPVRCLADPRVAHRRPDGWLEILLGEFFNEKSQGEIEIKILEIETFHWKRGLILEGIEFRPKDDA